MTHDDHGHFTSSLFEADFEQQVLNFDSEALVVMCNIRI
jgi:hypothetical protein